MGAVGGLQRFDRLEIDRNSLLDRQVSREEPTAKPS